MVNGVNSLSKLLNANLTAFHILLQNNLQPNTLLTSKLMNLPCNVYANNPYLNASAPHSGIPSLYSLAIP